MYYPQDVMAIDLETYSAAPLPEVGLKNYVTDPTFIITLAAVATSTGTRYLEFPDAESIRALTDGAGVLVAHNAGFERACLGTLGLDLQIQDSAVVAAVAGADRNLAGAARQLLDEKKLDEDRSLIRLFAMPQEGQEDLSFDSTVVYANFPKWLEYIRYCRRDAELSRRIFVEWSGASSLHLREMQYAQLTLEMNERGWPVDMHDVRNMRDRVNENLDSILEDFANFIDPDLNLASHDQVKRWCAERGVRSSSFDKQAVEKLLAKLEKLVTPTKGQREVQAMLNAKQALGGSSVKKLNTIIDLTHKGRLYDQYFHAGAPQTLRTTGRGVQMQNLPRLPAEPKDMDTLVSGEHWTNEEIGENLRQVFRAEHEYGMLFVADFASIESRGLALLAGEHWKLDAYARGEDIYRAQAMKIFGLRSILSVTKDQRTTGKVGELSCGYGAGSGAVRDFAEKMHVMLTETEAKQLVFDWRDANPEIVSLWNKLDTALKRCVATGRSAVADANGMTVTFQPARTPSSLRDLDPKAQSVEMLLTLSGKVLLSRVFHGCYQLGGNIGYWKPSSLKGGEAWKRTYVDPKTKRRRYYELYGGKLAGILTQSLCRGIFFETLSRLADRLRYVDNVQIIGQFHDEIIVEWEPGDFSEKDLHDVMSAVMNHTELTPLLPMAVEVKSARRYIK